MAADTAATLNLSLFVAKAVFVLPVVISISLTALIKVPHRHCVFTIAKELRPFFLKRPLSFKLSFFSSKQCHLPYVFQYQ